MLMVAEPSSWLAGARIGRSPVSGERKSRPLCPRSALEAPGRRLWTHLKGAKLHLLGGNVQDTSFCFCEGDGWGGR